MKVKTLQRGNTVDRECPTDLRKTSRNLDPKYHGFTRAREYQRAVVSAKLSRMFARPFLGDLYGGHGDAVTCASICRRSLVVYASGAADGSVKLWDLATRKPVLEHTTNAHTRTVTGITFDSTGQVFLSCSDDGFVKLWKVTTSSGPAENAISAAATIPSASSTAAAVEDTPMMQYRIDGSFKSIDHHWREPYWATASDSAVQIWSMARTTPISTYEDLWGSTDTVHCVRYHPVQTHLVAHCSMDRGIGLHDTRTHKPLAKTVLRMRSNDLRWNPMEPMEFVVANEDHNAYTFDMRRLDRPTFIFKGHASAILSVAWSPTGKEFVTGSYDRTIRIFPKQQSGISREIYHTKRMQRVTTVEYTMDHTYILSGSDDGNLRIWKARADERLGTQSMRQTAATEYRQALLKRHAHLPEIKKIVRHRKIPKAIRNQNRQTQIQKEAEARKHANRVKYSKRGEHKFVPERDKVVVKKLV